MGNMLNSYKFSNGEGYNKSESHFDWEAYINKYPDLKKAGIDTESKAIKHWKKYGKKENRICCYNLNNVSVDSFDSIEKEKETTNSIECSIPETVAESVSETVAESVSETVAETVSETVAESVSETVAESVSETVAETVSEPVVETVPEPVPEPITEPVAEPVTEPVAEPVA